MAVIAHNKYMYSCSTYNRCHSCMAAANPVTPLPSHQHRRAPGAALEAWRRIEATQGLFPHLLGSLCACGPWQSGGWDCAEHRAQVRASSTSLLRCAQPPTATGALVACPAGHRQAARLTLAWRLRCHRLRRTSPCRRSAGRGARRPPSWSMRPTCERSARSITRSPPCSAAGLVSVLRGGGSCASTLPRQRAETSQ